MRTRGTEARRAARRLLVITYHFGPDGPVGGLRWGGLAKYLARLGWNVTVVTATPVKGIPTGAGAQVVSCPRLWTLMGTLKRLRRWVLGGSSEWSPVGARTADPSGSPAPLRHLRREAMALLTFPDEGRGWILQAAWRARRLVRRFRPDVVISSGPPHSAHLVAGVAALGIPVPWLIDLRDPWAGPLPKIWDSVPQIGSAIARTLSPVLERLALQAAQGIIANTDQLAAELAARCPEVPVVCVPNGVDLESLPLPAPDRYPGLGVAHAGTLYAGRDAGPVVQALRVLFERYPEAAEAGSKLRLAGGAESGHARAFHEAVAAARMERYVEVLGPLPRGQALKVVSRSRLAVVLAQHQELQVPAKLYESVAMGVPTLVIAPSGSATALEGRRIGAVVCDAKDVEGIAGLLEQLWRDGSQGRRSTPASITYQAIARLVDRLLHDPSRAGLAWARVSRQPREDEHVEGRSRDGRGRVRSANGSRRRNASHR